MAEERSNSAPDFESQPLTRPEYIAAMVHLYRGELARANLWRTRLDTTSNWAIIAVMGLLSFAFSDADHSHASIIVGMLLTLHFLTLEARRFRVYDVWHNRVRMIEENFYGPILTRDLQSPEQQWGKLVAHDLLQPCFKITYLQAMRSRLKRNYLTLFLVLLAAWVGKLSAATLPGVESWSARMGVGPLPGALMVVVVAGVYGFLAYVLLAVPAVEPPDAQLWAGEQRAPRLRE